MKRFKLLIATGALCILLSALLTGCSGSFLSVGTQFPDYMTLKYGNFKGDEVSHVSAKRGQEITLNYEAKVQRGELSLAVQDPSGVIMWSAELTSDSTDTVTLVTDQTGEYAIIVTGKDTKGSYEVSWEVE